MTLTLIKSVSEFFRRVLLGEEDTFAVNFYAIRQTKTGLYYNPKEKPRWSRQYPKIYLNMSDVKRAKFTLTENWARRPPVDLSELEIVVVQTKMKITTQPPVIVPYNNISLVETWFK